MARNTRRIAATLAALFVAFFAWILWSAYAGRDNPFFQLVRATPHGDKIGHVFMAGLLTIAANVLCRFRTFRIGRVPVGYGSAIAFVALAIEELSQAFSPLRTLDILDATANLTGIAITSVFAYRIARRKAALSKQG